VLKIGTPNFFKFRIRYQESSKQHPQHPESGKFYIRYIPSDNSPCKQEKMSKKSFVLNSIKMLGTEVQIRAGGKQPEANLFVRIHGQMSVAVAKNK